jgi:hypothetical protein
MAYCESVCQKASGNLPDYEVIDPDDLLGMVSEPYFF